MDYNAIVQAAKDFADRTDDPISNSMDNFIVLAEARMNRLFKTRNQSTKYQITSVANQQEYDLPADYRGLRHIRIKTSTGTLYNVRYLTPEQFSVRSRGEVTLPEDGFVYYCILGNKLCITPSIGDNTYLIELFYYRKVPNLNSVDTTNWVSLEHPDMYIFGLQSQIAKFLKDYQASEQYDKMLADLVAELKDTDEDERWGGPPMTARKG